MPVYSVSRPSAALSVTADHITLVGVANRAYRLLFVSIAGTATASAANVVMLQRSTGGATPSAAITPAPLEPSSPAAGFSAWTAWVTQPTLTANTIQHRLGVNANGGVGLLYMIPPLEVKWRGTEQLSIRSETGTSTVTMTVIVEEI